MLRTSCRADGDQTTRTEAVRPYHRVALATTCEPSHGERPLLLQSRRAPWQWRVSQPPRRFRRIQILVRTLLSLRGLLQGVTLLRAIPKVIFYPAAASSPWALMTEWSARSASRPPGRDDRAGGRCRSARRIGLR